MSNSTKDYNKFKFLEQNRPIDKAHVRHLANSIGIRNMMEKFPIVVNKKFEILDGQHRLEACKFLNIPVFYRVDDDIETDDIIQLNVNRKWTLDDYFNFYVKKGVQDFVDLNRWMQKTDIGLRVAMGVLGLRTTTKLRDFRNGKLDFKQEGDPVDYETINESIEIMKKHNGYQNFVKSTKFWKAMLFLIRMPDFNKEHWFKNLNKMASRVEPLITVREYLKSFIAIYNYYAPNKLNIQNVSDMDNKY